MSTELSSRVSAEGEAVRTWEPTATAKWRENPERLAWVVILTSFAIFCALAIAIPLSLNYAVRYMTVSETARVEPTLGTLLLYLTESSEAIAITSSRDDISEGNRLVTTEDSTQGILALISTEQPGQNEVLGSVQLYSNTNLQVQKIRRPWFKRSREPYQVRLRLENGQARIFTNSGDSRPVRVEVETPHGVIQLDAGSYWVVVTAQHTDVTVRDGAALLWQGEHQLTVRANLRGRIEQSGLAEAAVSAEQNLIENGSFNMPALDAWPSRVTADNTESGSVQFVERDGRNVAYFIRQGVENAHNEVEIRQQINADVNVYDSLMLQLDVNILFQNLSGAGYLGTEFPVRIELNYTDIYGKELTWGWGFYYREPEDSYPQVVNGDRVSQAQWFTYQSPNLILLLDQQGTRPARINSVRIYASGWNYQSMVSEVYLIAQ
jgi:hypothetical protein